MDVLKDTSTSMIRVNMRQKSDRHGPISKHTSSLLAVSQPNLAPAVFSKNQNTALCLPLLSENQKIIWVNSDQVNIPVEKAAKLDEAFSRFPYVTEKQTLSLAQQCSLHPDQVKVWFMAQRLCYGISWDSKDIHEVRRKMFGASTMKRQVKCETKITTEPKLNKDEHETETIKISNLSDAATGQMVADNMQGGGRKRKLLNKKADISDDIEEKTSRVLWPGVAFFSSKEVDCDTLSGSCTKQKATNMYKTEGDSFAISDECLDQSPPDDSQSQSASSVAPLFLVKHEKEQMGSTYPPPQTLMVTQRSQTTELDVRPTKEKRRRRPSPSLTPKQCTFMKTAFIKQQYLTDEQYRELSSVSGIPRHGLVQWFSDMRYFIKKCKPKWMTVEQHKRAVANVLHEQCLRKMQ